MFGSFQCARSEFGQSADLIVVVPPPPAPTRASGFVALRKGGRAAITHLPRTRKETTRHFVEFARVSGTCACVAAPGICEGVGRVQQVVNAEGAVTARRASCAGTGLVIIPPPVAGFLCARSRPGRCYGIGGVDFEPIDEQDVLELVGLLDE